MRKRRYSKGFGRYSRRGREVFKKGNGRYSRKGREVFKKGNGRYSRKGRDVFKKGNGRYSKGMAGIPRRRRRYSKEKAQVFQWNGHVLEKGPRIRRGRMVFKKGSVHSRK